jgi:hypothetical protein
VTATSNAPTTGGLASPIREVVNIAAASWLPPSVVWATKARLAARLGPEAFVYHRGVVSMRTGQLTK